MRPTISSNRYFSQLVTLFNEHYVWAWPSRAMPLHRGPFVQTYHCSEGITDMQSNLWPYSIRKLMISRKNWWASSSSYGPHQTNRTRSYCLRRCSKVSTISFLFYQSPLISYLYPPPSQTSNDDRKHDKFITLCSARPVRRPSLYSIE